MFNYTLTCRYILKTKTLATYMLAARGYIDIEINKGSKNCSFVGDGDKDREKSSIN